MSGEAHFEVYPQHRTVTEGGVTMPGGVRTVEEPTGEYGWRFRAANGEISATGGESFTREEDAERAIKQFAVDSGVTEMPAPIVRIGADADSAEEA
jgi:uncharacterized protein YegP (UPF0339 family)